MDLFKKSTILHREIFALRCHEQISYQARRARKCHLNFHSRGTNKVWGTFQWRLRNIIWRKSPWKTTTVNQLTRYREGVIWTLLILLRLKVLSFISLCVCHYVSAICPLIESTRVIFCWSSERGIRSESATKWLETRSRGTNNTTKVLINCYNG